MIDIHAHVLPATDDGARTFAESLAMLDIAAADGVTDLIATPHDNQNYRLAAGRADEDLRLLQAASPQPRLHKGCELLLTPDGFDRLTACPSSYTLAGSRYVLVEIPDFVHLPIVLDSLSELLRLGLRPIVAHPERTFELRDVVGVASEVVERGCYVQLTARSMLGGFGPETERAAERLLESGLTHLVASDAHGQDHRRPLLRAARDRVAHWFDPGNADLLFEGNGRAVLADRPLLPLSIRRVSRVRYRMLSIARQRVFHAG